MTILAIEKRQQVVREAETWIGTPYHKRSVIKGVGADCFTFISAVMVKCGLFQLEDLPAYHDDWFSHKTDQVYMNLLLKYARKMVETIAYRTAEAYPGDIVVMQTPNSKIFNHGGIVVEWPIIIHAISPAVQKIDASRDPMWTQTKIEVFSPYDR